MLLTLRNCEEETDGKDFQLLEFVFQGDNGIKKNKPRCMKDLSWKTLSSEYIYKETWFTIRKDTCENAEGKIISPYYVYEFPTWVTAVALTEDRKIILERQYRHALNQTNFEIPGGCVDDTDASLEDAIKRELQIKNYESGSVKDGFLTWNDESTRGITTTQST